MRSFILLFALTITCQSQIIRVQDDIYNIITENDTTKEGYTYDKDFQIIDKKNDVITTFCDLSSSDFFQLSNIYDLRVCDSTGCMYVEKRSPFEPTIIIRELEEKMFNKSYVVRYRK